MGCILRSEGEAICDCLPDLKGTFHRLAVAELASQTSDILIRSYPDDVVRAGRLSLTLATLNRLERTLDLIGIATPERM